MSPPCCAAIPLYPLPGIRVRVRVRVRLRLRIASTAAQQYAALSNFLSRTFVRGP